MRKHNTSIKLAFSLKIWDEFYMFSVSYRAALLECVFVVSFSNFNFFFIQIVNLNMIKKVLSLYEYI